MFQIWNSVITTKGNKFARQVGRDGRLEAVRFNVYMNGWLYAKSGKKLWSHPLDPRLLQARVDDARQYGFHNLHVGVCNSWFQMGTKSYREHKSKNPDLRTFAVLEKIVATVHGRGGHVHFWAWGDEQRRWTPIGVGGINGVPDKRLQRYIAARLGPLPGWSMGYGFDLQEWVTEEQVGEWAKYMHQHMGWRHLLCARGRSHPELDVKSYSGFSVRTYAQIVRDLNSDTTRPHFYEERHTYLRNAQLSMTGTRRFLWQQALAGGMGGFWGFYGPSYTRNHPYPNSEQLRTCSRFWEGRFLLDMKPANRLTDGYCLQSASTDSCVFYKEDAETVEMDLSGMKGPQPAVAVDTVKPYKEIKLGRLKPAKQTWKAPHKSDWAVAVGTFK